MSALVLRLGGPAQSWGGATMFQDIRPTEIAPTRSGLLGLLAASLGFHRGCWPQWLLDTKFTVRMDNPGAVRTDYHTVNKVPARMVEHYRRQVVFLTGKVEKKATAPVRDETAKPTKSGKKQKEKVLGQFISLRNGEPWSESTSETHREFISGGEFVVTIEHPDRLDEIAAAVRKPHFTTYLGRKMFAPTFPFYLGVFDGDAEQVFSLLPVLGEGQTAVCEIHDVDSDRSVPRVDPVYAPAVPDREGQLAWAKENLVR